MPEWHGLWWYLWFCREIQNSDQTAPGQNVHDSSGVSKNNFKLFARINQWLSSIFMSWHIWLTINNCYDAAYEWKQWQMKQNSCFTSLVMIGQQFLKYNWEGRHSKLNFFPMKWTKSWTKQNLFSCHDQLNNSEASH